VKPDYHTVTPYALLKALMITKGVTVTEFAKEIGITRTYLNGAIVGTRKPTMKIKRMCRNRFGFPMRYWNHKSLMIETVSE